MQIKSLTSGFFCAWNLVKVITGLMPIRP
jgi:hypothetical protein